MSRWARIFFYKDSRGLRRNFRMRIAIGAVVFFLSFILSMAAGQQALDLGGSRKDPLKETPGKVVVLVFVRTDCPISNRYAPLLQEMSVKYGGEAAFWLVFPDKNESPESIRSYLQEFNYKLPALRDTEHSLVKKTGAKVTPEVAVFNLKRDLVYHGRIDDLYREFGKARRVATTHELADAIEAASKGVAPPSAAAEGIGCFISDLK
jgi:thiol-disulfide isomerase/thioredoxin